MQLLRNFIKSRGKSIVINNTVKHSFVLTSYRKMSSNDSNRNRVEKTLNLIDNESKTGLNSITKREFQDIVKDFEVYGKSSIPEELEILRDHRKAIEAIEKDTLLIDIGLFSLLTKGYEPKNIPKNENLFTLGCSSVLWYINLEEFGCPSEETVKWIIRNNPEGDIWLYFVAAWSMIGGYNIDCPFYCMEHARLAAKYGCKIPEVNAHLWIDRDFGIYSISKCQHEKPCDALTGESELLETNCFANFCFTSSCLPYKVTVSFKDITEEKAKALGECFW
jgi:hypothetical protein